MHHVALNGTGAHDRHFDDKIVEFFRFQARQHVHLGPAFHLEHADCVGPLQHVVDRFVLARHGRQRQELSLMQFDEVEGFADAGQHAERQHIDLHHPQRVDIVLVPFNEPAILHGGGTDRHDLIETVTSQNKAADMLR